MGLILLSFLLFALFSISDLFFRVFFLVFSVVLLSVMTKSRAEHVLKRAARLGCITQILRTHPHKYSGKTYASCGHIKKRTRQ
jgi:hypothetical protein